MRALLRLGESSSGHALESSARGLGIQDVLLQTQGTFEGIMLWGFQYWNAI
jgi:hypothetical protein